MSTKKQRSLSLPNVPLNIFSVWCFLVYTVKAVGPIFLIPRQHTAHVACDSTTSASIHRGGTAGATSRTYHRKKGGTQLTKVVKSFDFIASHHHLGDDDIDAKRLLDSCQTFLSVLKKTGPKAVARDFERNLHKAQSLYKVVNQNHDRHHPVTLKRMLATERDFGIHSGSKLKDPSGAMGLLWMRRSLAFQSELYSQVLQHTSPRKAALRAYATQLKPYHGWALQKFYIAFLSTKMPSRQDMLKTLGGYSGSAEITPMEERKTTHDLQQLVSVWKPLLVKWKRTFCDLGLEDTRRV